MPKWLKIVLILFGVGLLGFGALVGGIVWWVSANKDRIVEGTRAAQTQGKEYGRTHNKTECLDESVRQVKSCGMMDLVCETSTKMQLMACVPNADDDGVCATVPQPTAIFEIASWADRECTKRGMKGSQPCSRVVQGMLQACMMHPQ